MFKHLRDDIYTDSHDTRPIFYLGNSERTLGELAEIIQGYWPGCDLSKIRIDTTMEATGGCGCHPHPSDYSTFLRIERCP
jgi:hypothetical protein